MEETENGTLTIIPGDMKKTEEQTTILIRNEMNADIIYYEILRAYFDGYVRIILSGKLTDEQMDFLEIIHKRIVGLEVIEQKKDQIIIADLLRPEDVDLDKIINQMFSFITAMASDIIIHINEGKSPRDKIIDRDSVTTRNYNLAYKCCTMALRDSMYLSKLKKTTNEIMILSRIIRYLDMIGTTLVGISYLINTKMTKGMKKYHYTVFEKDKNLNKSIEKYLRNWLKYFRSIKIVLQEKNFEKTINLYMKRFEIILKTKNSKSIEHLTHATNLTEQLNKMSSLILRDFMMY